MSKENPKAAPEEVMNSNSVPELKKPMGRPTMYTDELASKVLEQLSLGKSMRKVCETEGMPNPETIWKWIRTKPDFNDQYTRAKDEGAEAMFDYLVDIADDARNDFMEDEYMKGKTPGYQLNGENIQRSKLRVDTYKWYISKIKPRKYGEKIDMTSNGKDVIIPILGGLSKESDMSDGDSVQED